MTVQNLVDLIFLARTLAILMCFLFLIMLIVVIYPRRFQLCMADKLTTVASIITAITVIVLDTVAINHHTQPSIISWLQPMFAITFAIRIMAILAVDRERLSKGEMFDNDADHRPFE